MPTLKQFPASKSSTKKESQEVVFFLNGLKIRANPEDSFLMLSEYLKRRAGLPGTKVVCAEGDCGACSILVAWPHRETWIKNPTQKKAAPRSSFRLINSCIMPVHQLHASSVVTVEGLEKNFSELSEVQESLIKNNSSQCGFCTPGFAVALTHLCLQSEKRDPQSVKNYCTGNLCRCTGYESLIQAGSDLSKVAAADLHPRYLNASIKKELSFVAKKELRLKANEKTLIQPQSIAALAKETKILKPLRESRILGSGTDLGVLHNKEKIELSKVISLSGLPALFQIHSSKNFDVIGAKVDLETLRRFFKKSHPEFSTFLNLFASPPIRNTATLAGNIANASPIGDTPPYLLILEAAVKIQSVDQKGKATSSWIPLNSFYKAYKVTALKPGEWISEIKIPKPKPSQFIRLYKISQRRDLDISSVSAALSVEKTRSGLENFKIALGGISAYPLRMKELETHFNENGFNVESVDLAIRKLPSLIKPLSDLRASREYRLLMVAQFLKRFLRELSDS